MRILNRSPKSRIENRQYHKHTTGKITMKSIKWLRRRNKIYQSMFKYLIKKASYMFTCNDLRFCKACKIEIPESQRR